MAHWIVEDLGFGGANYRCSECGNVWNDIYAELAMDETCPGCGAPIDEPIEYVEDMVEQSPDEPEKDTSNIRDELKRVIYDSMKAFSGADLLLYILSLKHVVDEIYKEVNDALGGDDKDKKSIYVNSMVFKSRYTPGLENATDIRLDVGEHVMWRGKSGDTVEIIIDSELMHNSGHLGYESIFTDTNERAFACSDQIIDWEGKV